MKNKHIIIIFSVIVTISIFLCIILIRYNTAPLSSEKDEIIQRIEIPAGTTSRKIAKELAADNIIRNANMFYLAARFRIICFIAGSRTGLHLASGLYTVKSSMSVAQIFDLLSSGHQDYIRVSFPEGLTISKIGIRLEKAGVCSAADFKKASENKKLLSKYHISGSSFEGYLFPDTYFFNPKTDSTDIVIIMVQNFFDHVKQIPSLSSMSPEEFRDTIILASIVEHEYRIDEEAPLIASVFRNRIRKGIGLYSCATIEYIITEIEGKPHPDIITYKDLKINSPYNTYKWAALPPGPISNPGMVALKAASDTPATNYYYFRLIDPDTGRHAFTENFNEHIHEGTLLHTKR